MITAVFVAVLMQSAAINGQRDKYIACLKQGAESAKTQKLAPDAIEAHLRTSCAAVESTFKASLIAFDVKNSISRKQAASDAQLQVDDFVINFSEKYKVLAAKQ